MTKETYAAKVARKRELALHHGLRLATVTAEDLDRLREVFVDWLGTAAGHRGVGAVQQTAEGAPQAAADADGRPARSRRER
ncbi:MULTISPECIES: hypothetical protein [unclassified Streptomyces]|uniref:hypothetical protein n=1 Tax=unclassified Streptomyces TaxID=2593676 RepID=UPI001F07468A|nr:hypothetical protein [Streptomyces sp. CB09001]